MKSLSPNVLKPLWILPLVLLTGCPVTQSQNTPVEPISAVEPRTGRTYRYYVPSYYSPDRSWPLVVTLHGTTPIWDGYRRQVDEWKALAEKNGFIVVAPDLRGAEGILPRIRSVWYKDLESDERAILAIMDELESRYRIDRQAVMLTGFSAGGFPMYWTGLRNPTQFSMLVARACNGDQKMAERAASAGADRSPAIFIFCGKADILLRNSAWKAYRFFRERGYSARRKSIDGAHWRRPDVAWQHWKASLPERYRRPPR